MCAQATVGVTHDAAHIATLLSQDGRTPVDEVISQRESYAARNGAALRSRHQRWAPRLHTSADPEAIDHAIG